MIDDGFPHGDEPANEGDMSIDQMPDVQDDETLRDVVSALSVLPVVAEGDIQRIVARAAAEASETGRRSGHRWAAAKPARESRDAADIVPLRPARPRWFTTMPMAAAAGLVLAAGIGGYMLRDATIDPAAVPAGEVAAIGTPAGTEVVPVAATVPDARVEAPISTQFVLDAPAAAKVALVGAFNGWDAAATPLVRDPATGLWTVTLPLAPGRHVYAFMVNDTALTLDPRAPSTTDPELGAKGSVILVGAP